MFPSVPLLFFLFCCPVLLQLQSCQPKYLLPSTIQDTLQLSSFSSANSASQYLYNYNPNLFPAKPTSLISLTNFGITNYAQINYQLTTTIQNNQVIIVIKSTNMAWNLVKVNLVLHSRNDIYSQVNSIAVMANVPKNVKSVQQSAVTQGTYLFVHHILGINAVYNINYMFKIDDGQIGNLNTKYILSSNTNTTFIIQTVYINTNNTLLTYGIQQLAITGNTYSYIVSLEFAPVIYTLIGFNTLAFSSMAINVNTQFNNQNGLLTVQNTGLTQLNAFVFAFGNKNGDVCSPCNNFITLNTCKDTCAADQFAYSFVQGGKTCRPCLAQLGQTSTPTGCKCNNNAIYSNGNCYPISQSIPPTCPPNTLLLNNLCTPLSSSLKCPPNSHADPTNTKCLCDQSFQLSPTTSQCIARCPDNSQRTSFGICACKYGYIMNSKRTCQSICPANSIYQIQQQQCKCNYGYTMINGVCSQCPIGQIYDPSTQKCLTAFYAISNTNSELSICKINEIVINGVCQCDQWSVKIDDRCVGCPSRSFKMDNICQKCPEYCLNCSGSSGCQNCQRGFDNVNGECRQICGDGRKFEDQCDDGNTINGDGCSSTCTVQPGYICQGGSSTSTSICLLTTTQSQSLTISLSQPPIYSTSGIITNLLINPPVTHSQSQLWQFITITFNPLSSRPNKIYLNQNQNDPASIRCFFDYNNNLVVDPFTVVYQVRNEQIGRKVLRVNYDAISGGVTSAIGGYGGRDDVDRLHR